MGCSRILKERARRRRLESDGRSMRARDVFPECFIFVLRWILAEYKDLLCFDLRKILNYL